MKEAQASVACSTEQREAQSNAEDALKLQRRKRTDTSYALALGRQDSARMQKSRALSAELQQEITVKIRFFRREAKAAYLRSITSAVSEFAEPEQVVDILAEPCTSSSSPDTRDDIPCDIAQAGGGA